jgi:uncharacterized protein YbjT (DUF2867 family)
LLARGWRVITLSRRCQSSQVAAPTAAGSTLLHIPLDISQDILSVEVAGEYTTSSSLTSNLSSIHSPTQHKEALACLPTALTDSAHLLSQCKALINLVGVKRDTKEQSFHMAHVVATRNLIRICRLFGIPKIIHVSVLCSRADVNSPYHDTKQTSEDILSQSGLDYTIVRPSVVFGEGDDMLTSLIRGIKLFSIFPLVRDGSSLIQPVHVLDVAEAIAAILEDNSSSTSRKVFPIVGPKSYTLRELVTLVAEGVGLPILPLYTPISVHQIVASVSSALMSEPMITPAQLKMLDEGMIGEKEPTYSELQLKGRELTVESVQRLEASIPPLFGISLRLLPSREDKAWIIKQAKELRKAMCLILVAVLGMMIFAAGIDNVWLSMLLLNTLLFPLVLSTFNLDWRSLLRPTTHNFIGGLLFGVFLYLSSLLGFGVLAWVFPALAEQKATLHSWTNDCPNFLLRLLVLTYVGTVEEMVWRGAILLPIAAHMTRSIDGTATFPCLLAAGLYALAHWFVGPPLLIVAAMVMGCFWGGSVLRTRSIFFSAVAHVLFSTLSAELG